MRLMLLVVVVAAACGIGLVACGGGEKYAPPKADTTATADTAKHEKPDSDKHDDHGKADSAKAKHHGKKKP